MSKEDEKQKVILVYEDDPTFRSSFVSALETRGFKVFVANAPGETSMQQVKEMKPDLISFDIMMPGMTGIEWAQALRRDPAFANTPFVFVSSISDQASQQEAQEVNPGAYMIKFQTPITDIVGKIDKLLH